MDIRRPTTDSLARAAADAINTVRKLTVFPSTPDEKSGAPFFSDLAAIKQRSEPERSVYEGLMGLVPLAIEVCWSAAEDHLAALETDLRRRPHAVWSGLTLARALHEAVIFISYIAEPSLPLDERLFRIGNTWLEDANNKVNASPDDQASGETYRADAISERDFCIAELRKGGFTVGVRDGFPRSLQFGPYRTKNKIGLPTTDQAKLLLPVGAPEPYRLASGAAHARPWFLIRNAVRDPAGLWSSQMDVTGTAVMIAARAVEEGMRMQGGFYGIDTTIIQAQIRAALIGFLRTLAQERA